MTVIGSYQNGDMQRMDTAEMIARIELVQEHRLEKSRELADDIENSFIGDPDSYGDDDGLTFEAQQELTHRIEQIEQYKRGYHNAMEHVKQMLKGEPGPLTHSGIKRYYE